MNLADIKHLFDYTEWANARAMDAAADLTDEDLRCDRGISHRSIYETLLHMAAAEWIWLERWNGRSPVKEEAWPRWSTESVPALTELQTRWADLIDNRNRYFSGLDESSLDAELHFNLLSGDPSSMRLGHQMQHVVNHATLHRGQVVGMILQLGLEPPSTDFLFYVRPAISPK
jgi:uncharacterized damage-inducible protein DinB